MRQLVEDAHLNASSKGFWDDCKSYSDRVRTIPEKLALIHSEVSEALECYRDGDMDTTVNADKVLVEGGPGKPEGFPSELADIIIRVFDLAGALQIDLQAEVELKMAYNATRRAKHGKVC